MAESKKRIKYIIIFHCITLPIILDCTGLLSSVLSKHGHASVRHYEELLTKVLLIAIFVVCTRIYEGRTLRQWRAVMKKNIIPWIVLLLFLAAFVILMVEAYTYIENQKDAILLIVASVVLFLPNLWALTDYIALKIKNTRQKTGDGLREP